MENSRCEVTSMSDPMYGPHAPGEVRLCQIGTGGVIACRACFERYVEWAKRENEKGEVGRQIYVPTWEGAQTYGKEGRTMAEQKTHAEEPLWKVDEATDLPPAVIEDVEDGWGVCQMEGLHTPEGIERAKRRAHRIVACVNGCAGINPEAVGELLAACEAALPNLICAAKDYAALNEGRAASHQTATITAVVAAIAKAKQ